MFCDSCLQNSIVIRTMIYTELLKNNMFMVRVWKWSFKTMLAIGPMSLNNWNTRFVKTRYMIHWIEAMDKHSCTALKKLKTEVSGCTLRFFLVVYPLRLNIKETYLNSRHSIIFPVNPLKPIDDFSILIICEKLIQIIYVIFAK